jgi:hypothetical protein
MRWWSLTFWIQKKFWKSYDGLNVFLRNTIAKLETGTFCIAEYLSLLRMRCFPAQQAGEGAISNTDPWDEEAAPQRWIVVRSVPFTLFPAPEPRAISSGPSGFWLGILFHISRKQFFFQSRTFQVSTLQWFYNEISWVRLMSNSGLLFDGCFEMSTLFEILWIDTIESWKSKRNPAPF